MKVFISWSGERSREIGDAFRQWLPSVLQAVKPYFSPDDIAKGTRWATDIAKELDACRLGLLILTPENVKASWLLFEAGALSKTIDKSKVCPILFDLELSDVTGPLVQFQGAKFEKEEIKRVVKMINSELGEQSLDSAVLDRTFEVWWPSLETEVEKRSRNSKITQKERRGDRDILEELLGLVRSSAQEIKNLAHRVTVIEHGRFASKVQSSPPAPGLSRFTTYYISLKPGATPEVLSEILDALKAIRDNARISGVGMGLAGNDKMVSTIIDSDHADMIARQLMRYVDYINIEKELS
jgi:hypothetical protein